MRRILAAALAALCLLASIADARVAVVTRRLANETSVTTLLRADSQTSRQRAMLYVTSFLNAYGASYDVVDAGRVQTSRIKDGFITGFNGDTAYSGVIWVGGSSGGTNPTAGCFPCSLTVGSNAGAMLPTKPQLFIPSELAENSFGLAASCSTGAGGDCYDPNSQGPGYEGQRVWMPGYSQYSFGWLVGSQLAATKNDKDGAASIRGGIRTLLGGGSSNLYAISGSGYTAREAKSRPAWRDSLYGATADATAGGFGGTTQGPTYGYYLLERLNRYGSATTYAANPFAPTMQAQWISTATPTHGGDGNNDLRPTGNPYPIWVGIAHMDSLANGWILGRGPTVGLQARNVAIQVSGGLSRGAWNLPGGLRPSDPNFAKGVDSLASLGVPFVVGIKPLADTIATYASDLATWQRAPLVKFAVETGGGISGSDEAGIKAATIVKPVDMLGRLRSRIFYGDLAADTTIYEMLVAARNRLDSLVTSSKRDGVLIAGNDDWSPYNWPYPSNSRDSLACAASRAGFLGVTNNAEDDSLDAATPSNPYGMNADQMAVPSGNGDKFIFSTFPGCYQKGAVAGVGEASVDSMWAQVYAHRHMRGLFLPAWNMDAKRTWVNNDVGMATAWIAEPISSYSSVKACNNTGTNIVRITASSLGYGGNGPTADMPGFYQVKYFVNMCKVLNIAAGRTLVKFVYPGDLTPEDLRR